MSEPKPTALSRRRVKFRYSASSTDLQALFAAARKNPRDITQHGVIADAVDELYPDNKVSHLIRRQFGLGEYGGRGPIHNVWRSGYHRDATYIPSDAYLTTTHLTTDGPFDIYLGHHSSETNPHTPPRWIVYAHPKELSDRSLYAFEFPHEEAHLIPKMFPAAGKWISHDLGAGRTPPYEDEYPNEVRDFRRREASQFDEAMNQQENN